MTQTAQSLPWSLFRHAYPVISRRAGGVSIGINLSPGRGCEFSCVYCEVPGVHPRHPEAVDLEVLRKELAALVRWTASGELFQYGAFREAPEAFRQLKCVTFSGDGEPTLSPQFGETVALVGTILDEAGLPETEQVLITDSAGLGRIEVQRALERLCARPHQIWAKLDAGTERHYRRVNRSVIPFEQILANLLETARRHPVHIQSLFLRLRGEPPSLEEIEAYCGRLRDLQAGGAKLLGLQLNTVARVPMNSWAEPLSNEELDAIAAFIAVRIPLPQKLAYGGAFQVNRSQIASRYLKS